MTGENRQEAIFPAILRIPPGSLSEKPPERVRELSRFARNAVMMSARQSRADIGRLEKNRDGVPQPDQGWYWSASHKPDYVGGVVARAPVGIDIEPIRACSEGLFRKTASPEEWKLAEHEEPDIRFFRYWTAKEAVLKARGTGIRELSVCRIIAVTDNRHIQIHCGGEKWEVQHHYFDGHIASVVKTAAEVQWKVTGKIRGNDRSSKPAG